jgi:glycosyltransferase involved in cell wall biosynthesis
MIANSSWLKNKLQKEYPDSQISLCPNAIDHSIYRGEPRLAVNSKHVTLISYGGRNAEWKGFKEMVAAVAIARRELPDITIEWKVFGDALIGPDNPDAPYTSLGFLPPLQLAEEYKKADILLSASWYESFPLFPVEAMACGLPVITTQAGTEEYAFHGDTAEIVTPKSPSAIAEGIVRLIKNPEYRNQLAIRGEAMSQNFTWQKSVQRLEEIFIENLGLSDDVVAVSRPDRQG